ncbi:hypothetical protein BH10PSE15_BH10PSE15_18260 [soil metagenome]
MSVKAGLRIVLLIAGALALAMGLLWIGQGLGVIRWPASSFMIDERRWTLYGAVLVVAGALLIARNRRPR